MKDARRKRDLIRGACLLAAFALWTVLIQTVDVRPAGPDGSRIGLAAFNIRFHSLTGVHMALYALTDWLGLVPVGVCLVFAGVGLRQLIGRKSLLKVDPDILLLGIHYILVISGYLFFETVPINYRPVLINGVLEASYPSSTTLLTLSVMPTLELQARRRVSGAKARGILIAFSRLFSALMVLGRSISGVHWASDIIGAVLLAGGLFTLYRSGAAAAGRETKQTAPKGPSMELSEKLQALRKSRGLTQEELAQALYVSRTAVSKWESGRGYPGIDSLREIARFFSVTIDELIRPEEILTAAEKDKRSFIDRYLSLICGLADLLMAVLLFLPVFGGTESGGAVALNALNPAANWIRPVFYGIIALTAACGLCEITVSHFDRPAWSRRLLITGMALSVAGTGVFIAARQPYAAIVYFIPLVIKGLVLLRSR